MNFLYFLVLMLDSTKTFPNFLGNIRINKTFLRHVIEYLTPVSYTHLDVYKRQSMAAGAACAIAQVTGVNDNMSQSHYHDYFELYFLDSGERYHCLLYTSGYSVQKMWHF